MENRRETFTMTRGGVDDPTNNLPWLRIIPMTGKLVEKLLHEQRLVVAKIVDAGRIFGFDSDSNDVQEIR